MKIHAKNETVKSTKLILPIDGLITIDKDGIAEVSDKCGEILINSTNDWLAMGKTTKTDVPEEDDKKDERELFVDKLNASTIAELKAMCAEAECPEKEWKSFGKKDLIPYLLAKFDAATDDEEE